MSDRPAHRRPMAVCFHAYWICFIADLVVGWQLFNAILGQLFVYFAGGIEMTVYPIRME